MRSGTWKLCAWAIGLTGCTQILGLDEDAHLASGSNGGASPTSSVMSSATITVGTGVPTCGDCTPANACFEGACDNGMCTSEPRAPGSRCDGPGVTGGVCTSDSACVECLVPADCDAAEPICTQDHRCVPATCINTMMDGDETAIDCGGSCSSCANGLACVVGNDCKSGNCALLVCTACTNDGQCPSGKYCDMQTDECELEKFNGETCLTANECQSTRCVMVTGGTKLCCDSDCAGTCDSCLAAETNAPDGSCAHARADVDPKDACGAGPCASGNCDGFGGCSLFAPMSSCTAPSCVGTAFDPPDVCDAGGNCVPTAATTCANFTICEMGVCLPGCAAQNDCADNYYCQTPTCMPKKGPMEACSYNYECLSNKCKSMQCK